MKKSLLSVVLCVALLLGAMSTMLAMPASAAAEVNALDYEYSVNIPGSEDPASATVTKNANGSVTINFPKDDKSEVVFNLGEGAKVKEIPNVLVSLESTLKFDLCFYDANNGKYILAAGDYFPQFNEQVAGSNASGIAAGKYEKVTFDLGGAYRWNAQTQKPDLEVPDNAVIVTIAIVPKGTGTMTINKLAMNDGMESFDLNTRGDISGYDWNAPVAMINGTHKNYPADAGNGNSDVTVTNKDGAVVFGNTNGAWPFAGYTYSTPVVVDENAAIDLDFTVMPGFNTTIYIFLGDASEAGKGSTPDSFNYGTYVYIPNFDGNILNAELPSGYYKGTVFLKDILKSCISENGDPANAYNADGKLVINGIKIAAIDKGAKGETGVIVNKMDLLTLKAKDDGTVEVPSTTKKEDRTTTKYNGANVGGVATTTVNKGGNGGNSANTGDSTSALLFVVVAMAAASVVTVSAVSKKAKSR